VQVGLRPYQETVKTAQGDWIRVRVGPFSTRQDAERAQQDLKRVGVTAAIIALSGMTAGDIPPLTSWDWFILTVAFISTGLGIWRGLIRTVFGLAAWILGLIGAPLLGMMIGERFGISGVPMWVLYVLAFLVTFIVVRVVGLLFLKGARSVGLAWHRPGARRRVGGGAGRWSFWW
jgi:hypothetical protein